MIRLEFEPFLDSSLQLEPIYISNLKAFWDSSFNFQKTYISFTIIYKHHNNPGSRWCSLVVHCCFTLTITLHWCNSVNTCEPEPEPPGDQRNPALSTISPADFPAPPCPCPCTVGPSLVKLLPRHRVVHPTADSSKFWISACSWITISFNLVSSLSKSLTTFLFPTSSLAASSHESYLGHLFFQQCGFSASSSFFRLFQLPLAWEWPTFPLHIFNLCATLWKYLLLKSSRMNKVDLWSIDSSVWNRFKRMT